MCTKQGHLFLFLVDLVLGAARQAARDAAGVSVEGVCEGLKVCVRG